MKVIKRDGSQEQVKFDKISNRIKKQTYGLNTDFVDYMEVSKKVINGLYDGVTTVELDNLAAETAMSMCTVHYDYSTLAARIAISSLHKSTHKKFSETAKILFDYVNPKSGEKAGMISDETYKVIQKYSSELDNMIVNDRDFNFDYFGYKTLEKSYLLKIGGKPAETPQHMYMRVAVGIWGKNLEMVEKTYELLSTGRLSHATPTLFNSGTKKPQNSSCFLLAIEDDSIKGIYSTLADIADISQNAGGVGLHVHNVRAKGSYIKGTNGVSNGLVPMLKVFNETARYVDQGGQKRKGSIAIYLEPWHDDIFDFLDLRKNRGKEELRARDLFLALWTPDLFMQRVKEDGMWTLMCPNECKGLSDVYDDYNDKAFTRLYEQYEKEGKGRRTIKARELWAKVLEAQIETGTPYILYKDAANRKSNQKNIGVIKSSNLCTEIMEVSTPDETAVCNLISMPLPKFVDIPKSKDKSKRAFNHQALYDATYQGTLNLNKIIDVNYYPTEKTKISNLKHRPIGIGVQGLADAFAILGYAFDSVEAKILNKEIFETIYFAAMTASADLAEKDGAYETFKDSPFSKGIFQFDMWGEFDEKKDLSGRWDWETLKKRVVKKGVRNSLLLAPMPTASSAQILGNNECFEAFTANIYKRNTLSGEYIVINKHLVEDLVNLNLWNDKTRIDIIKGNGSVQEIDYLPQDIKDRYKTVWEISQKVVIDMAADRGLFIDQSQSMNLFIPNVNSAKLNSALFYGWEKGLKTGMYYMRTMKKGEASKSLGLDTTSVTEINIPEQTPIITEQVEKVSETIEQSLLDGLTCSLESLMNGGDCEACGA